MKTTLLVKDEVNVKFLDLDPTVRKELVKKLSFMNPKARHMPSFKLGRWDGKVPFATIGGGTFYNLLDQALPIVLAAGYEVDIVDERKSWKFDFPVIDEYFVSDRVWPRGHPIEGEPILLRDYQVSAVNTYLTNLHCVQSLTTGSGKTLTTAVLSLLCESFGRTLVIVPSKTLVEQTEEDYINLGLDVGVVYGDRKNYHGTHTIATWQSLGALCRKKDDFDQPLPELLALLDNLVCVMVDEVHTAKGNVLKSLLTGIMANVPIRWGMTGTIPKEPHEFNNLLVSIGPVKGTVTAKELQEKGVLSECDIKILQTDDSNIQYSSYHDEYSYLVSNPDRIEWLSNTIKSMEGNTLVLVDRISTAKMLNDLIGDSVIITGSTKQATRKQEFKSVAHDTDKIIIATFGVASVGINVPEINNLVGVEFGLSFVRTIQSIGRVLRKGKEKNSATIYDVCSSMKFSKKHLTKRKEFYKDASYEYSVDKIHYRKNNSVG